jgi:hypothetical protein
MDASFPRPSAMAYIYWDNSMTYPEFGQYKSFVDPENPLCNAYSDQKGHVFYVEPSFYYGLCGYKEKRADRFAEIMAQIEQAIKTNPKTVFVGDYEHPFVKKDGFVYLEIQDIADPLRIYVEDKSRGSDYGD